ncbi:MAG: sigma-70 family RNA polymerase sigma factor, partial [Acidobacteriota bacterium]
MKSTRSEPDVESVTDTAFDNTGTSNPDVPLLVDHLFRRRATQMTATLVRILGAGRVDLAEEVVQEAMIEALRRWPFHGVPKNPGAWLIQVAKNKALDRLRRVGVRRDKEDEVERVFQRRARAEDLDQRFRDDELRLLFLTCHPALPREARIALTLKVAVGLGTAEIARAFLLREATVAGRIVRAKRTLRELGPDVVVPTHDDLSPRLDSVLDVLY